MNQRTCRNCPADISAMDWRRVYCSDRCKWAYKSRAKYHRLGAGFATCAVEGCGRGVASRGFCGPHYDRAQRNGDDWRNWPAVVEVRSTCDECDHPHLARGKCRTHYVKLQAERGVEWAQVHVAGGGTDSHKRRARRFGVQYEHIDRLDIFARDEWTCGLCGDLIDAGLKFPDIGCATLDHIVPMSRGGDHVPANVQAAHFGCNAKKGARGVEQWAS